MLYNDCDQGTNSILFWHAKLTSSRGLRLRPEEDEEFLRELAAASSCIQYIQAHKIVSGLHG